ncbi:response regulator [Bryocella elongata]|uniref:response regulator n=1 Tax=Bryocella elongata TaxID=863522 RepID=UPI001F3216C3|nr:response regulator [Bryocella elongata]
MKRNHILVVDDDSSLRRVMKMQLEEAGYAVSLASDGEEGWKLLRSLDPHLVITDLRMPTTGLQLLERVSHEACRRR